MKCRNFANSLLANLIPPKIRSWPKSLFGKSCSISHTSIDIGRISTNEGSKLDGVKSKNNHIIDIHNFESGFINFVYFF